MALPKLGDTIKDNEFRPQLENLLRITSYLQKVSSLIFLVLLLTIASCSLFIYFHIKLINARNSFHQSDIEFQEILFLTVTIMMIILGIFLLFDFSNKRKRGLIIFDELTEEIDWSNKRKEYIHKPPIETRIIIKDFLRNADLPFTSGAIGQSFYLVMFIVMLVTSIITKAL